MQPNFVTEPPSVAGTARLRTVAVTFLVVALLLATFESIEAVALLVTDGALAMLILAAALGWGLWPMHVLKVADGRPAWIALGATALGLGIVSAIALILGCAGFFSLLPLVAGLVFCVIYVLRHHRDLLPSSFPARVSKWAWGLLILAPFLALGILTAATPPGVLWAEEGFGYDVLEYHLALPAEYWHDGRISYLPHNVYASFPANVEMLYLWAVVLRGDPIAAVFIAKMLNMLLGVLAVCACALAASGLDKRGPLLGALLFGGSGWLVYLSGIAYVENGLLFFAALAVAATLQAPRADMCAARRWALLAGLFAGLACGCKYSAIGLVAGPIFAVFLLDMVRRRKRAPDVLAYVLGVLVAFAPWLVKNSVMTGDPLFPLGAQIFGDYPAGWDAQRDAHFRVCHSPQLEEATPAGRVRRLAECVLADPEQRLASWLWPLALVSLFAAWRNHAMHRLWLILLLQLLAWLLASHLYARFAVPMLIPLALLVVLVYGAVSRCTVRRIFTGFVFVGLLVNLFFAARLYVRHLYPVGEQVRSFGLPRLFLQGHWPMQEHLGALNTLPPDSKILLVGDARSFYVLQECDYCVTFNLNPLAEQVARAADNGSADWPGMVLAWLRDQGYTHVLVNWAEIARLRGSRYGFAPEITPDLFGRLEAAGLTVGEVFRTPLEGRIYAVLYRVP